MAMTIYDISKKAGVSIATVSRVLNGSENVRPSTRKKVMDVIDKYDYTPNAFARGMGLHSLKTIGILCADSSDLFLAKAVYFLEQELQAQGYSLEEVQALRRQYKEEYSEVCAKEKVVFRELNTGKAILNSMIPDSISDGRKTEYNREIIRDRKEQPVR